MDSSTIEQQLLSGDEETFSYSDNHASIDCHKTSPHSAEVGHLVVARPERGDGRASKMMETLIEVLRDEGVTLLTVEIQVTGDSSDEDFDLDSDPTVEFLRNFGFTIDQTREDWQWGTLVKAHRST